MQSLRLLSHIFKHTYPATSHREHRANYELFLQVMQLILMNVQIFFCHTSLYSCKDTLIVSSSDFTEWHRVTLVFKGLFPDFSIIILFHLHPCNNLKSKILAYFDFEFASCTQKRVLLMPIDFYVENIIRSDNWLNNWQFCPNKQVLATLLQDYFLFFISLPPNQYKITKI